jgi:hypothetical protein
LFEVPTSQAGDDGVPFRRAVAQDTENLNVEFLDLGSDKDRPAFALHPDLDLVERHDLDSGRRRGGDKEDSGAEDQDGRPSKTVFFHVTPSFQSTPWTDDLTGTSG